MSRTNQKIVLMTNQINIENHIQNFKNNADNLRTHTREGKVDHVKQLESRIETNFKLIVNHPDFNTFHAEGLLDFVLKEKSDSVGKYRDQLLDEMIKLKQKQPKQETYVQPPVSSTMLLYGSGQPGC